MKYVVAAFYHFFDFPHFASLRAAIKDEFLSNGVKGTILLTPEGVNGTISGSREGMDATLAYLEKDVAGTKFEVKESLCDYQPFLRTKVKLKKETISIGEPAPLAGRGHYLDCAEWNALISDPDTLIIDTRNMYEVEMGTFKNAINPNIRTFKELPAFVRANHAEDKARKIATFCTGGIRCEKFTSWLADQGYENVYHLKGGILKYIEETPKQQSLWQGECFVFDDREAVDHQLSPVKN